MDLESPHGITIKLNDLFKSQIKLTSLEKMILKALRHVKERKEITDSHIYGLAKSNGSDSLSHQVFRVSLVLEVNRILC